MADTPSGKFESGDEATREAGRKGGEASGGGNR
jgi:general stress protein YciG